MQGKIRETYWRCGQSDEKVKIIGNLRAEYSKEIQN